MDIRAPRTAEGWLACIGLGANLPWQGRLPEDTVHRAMAELHGLGAVPAVSSLWRTAPVGPVTDQPEFVNAAAVLRTSLAPEELLRALRAIETRFGRERTGPAKGPRTLDLDLLLMVAPDGAPVLRSTEQLTLPHPEMHRRRFVLGPLAEIAPEAVHPVLARTVEQMLRAVR